MQIDQVLIRVSFIVWSAFLLFVSPFAIGNENVSKVAGHSVTSSDGPCARDLTDDRLATVAQMVLRPVPGRTERLGLSIPKPIILGDEHEEFQLLDDAMAEIRGRESSGQPVRKVLVLAAGIGYEAIALALEFPKLRIDAVDIDSRSKEVILHNLQDLALIGRVNPWPVDAPLLPRMGRERKYDLILLHAPRAVVNEVVIAYEKDLKKGELPELRSRLVLPRNRLSQKNVLGNFFEKASDYLNPRGTALVLTNQDPGDDLYWDWGKAVLESPFNDEILQSQRGNFPERNFTTHRLRLREDKN